jgi:hypothetical protein
MPERRPCLCPPRETVPDRTGLCWRCHGYVEPMEHLASVTEIRQPRTNDDDLSTAPLEAIALLTALIDDDFDAAAAIIEHSTNTARLALMAGCYGAAAWRLWRDADLDVANVLQQLALSEVSSS